MADNTLNTAIGSRIQQARKAAGFTQLAFAEKIGVSTQYISDLERGIVGASVPTIIKICDRLNVPTDYILRGFDPVTNQPVELLLELQHYSPQQQELIMAAIKQFQEAFQKQRPANKYVITSESLQRLP